MTVAELIKHLSAMPQNLDVHINVENKGDYIEDIEAVFEMPDQSEFDMPAVVVLSVTL